MARGFEPAQSAKEPMPDAGSGNAMETEFEKFSVGGMTQVA